MSSKTTRQAETIKTAILELIRLIIQRGCRIQFVPPDGESDGCFTASSMLIEIKKERPDKLTVKHVYALAHEYRHLCQYLALDGANSWLYTIDCFHQDDIVEDARLELEADRWAMDFLSERKLKVSKDLIEYVAERKEHYEEQQRSKEKL